ncbi:MAG: hypothetical protein NTV05_02485 [Acidobacteria bacterium]|nr:hypothetical protein [Acidobacteriota bacterium]
MNGPGIDIHLVPVGSQGYELYCEVEAQTAVQAVGKAGGLRGRIAQGFHRTILYVESERQRRYEHAHEASERTWAQRVRDRVVAWVAERVAEQRLLWHLRTQASATVHHPDDLSGAEASTIVMASLRRDARRHLVWMIIDACGFLAFLPLTAIPGPNLPTYYFSFRMIGHFLSAMGARHGLARVDWTYVRSAEMTELRVCAGLEADARDALAADVAARLNLRHLATFVERMTAVKPVL